MTDIVDKATRSRMMSGIRGKDTKPELMLRSALHRLGYRYTLHSTKIIGRPDLWLRRFNTAIFVDGCFWHRHFGCKFATTPKTRKDFWEQKFQDTLNRDAIVRSKLHKAGIRTVVVWECALRTRGAVVVAEKISEWLSADSEHLVVE